ncbi:hypothetical protein NB722_002879 [Xanthomonas sacchari]|uniref:hypothetical protein n=1 Tax=Xanthomonas sacchari TaxID=56458 RepID=UPI0022528659|nr:hypothetical protein [Xanthomonas sacchari]MCW0388340.1 hypothetical protein [Xanthomonas sacchari]
MLKTSVGTFDGASWETLCQQVFKKKYSTDGYQHIPASPGDFGLEGYCSSTGHAFQCYCPDNHYTRKELYEHQRDKITTDLNKLKTYQIQLSRIFGDTKISVWRLVTPEIGDNALIMHARAKEKEVRSWGLPFLTDDFTIQLHDADYYLLEINEIRSAAGEGLDFGTGPAALAALEELQEVYEKNVLRKSKARLAPKANTLNHASTVAKLHQITLDSFLESDGYFRRIEKNAPTLYFKLARLISEFEHRVQEQAMTWTGTPEDLTIKLRQDLEKRLMGIGSEMTETTADAVARYMVARWLAICTLDYE